MRKIIENIGNNLKNCIFVVHESIKTKRNATKFTEKTNTNNLGRRFGESPNNVLSKHSFVGSCNHLPSLFNFKFFKMHEQKKDKKENLDDGYLEVEVKTFENSLSFKKKYQEEKTKKEILYAFILDKGLTCELQNYSEENKITCLNELTSSVNERKGS